MADARRTFGPLVLLGGAAGALSAVACSKPWIAYPADTPDPMGAYADAGEMPLAAALSLVVLACWGVLLVTRARVRRVVAVIAFLAAVGVVATVVVGRVTLFNHFTEPMGFPQLSKSNLGWTGWFWTAAVASVLSVVASAAAVRYAPSWPEMGSRYDAPADAAAHAPEPDEDASNLDLWKAMDEGRDPTA